MNKLIFITGGDYCVLIFEKKYKGKTGEWLEQNREEVENFMLEEDPEFQMDIVEHNVSEDAFIALRDIWGDYDYMKSDNCYFNTI